MSAGFLAVVVVFVLAVDVAVSKTMCVAVSDPLQGLYILHAAERLALSSTQTKLIPLASSTQIPSLNRELVANNCSAVIGPGTSDADSAAWYDLSFAKLLSTATTVPVVDYGTIGGELADRREHPWYNRVVLADSSAMIATVAKRFGWEKIAVITAQNGMNVQLSVGDAQRLQVARSIVLRDKYLAELDAFFRLISADFSFVPIFVVVPNKLRRALTIAGLHRKYGTYRHKTLIFLQFAADCVAASRGSFCAHHTPYRPGTLAALFTNSSSATLRAVADAFPASQVTDADLSVPSDSNAVMVRALAADSVAHVAHVLQSTTSRVLPATLQSLLRSTVTDGYTGAIELSSSGERITAFLAIKNAPVWGVWEAAATYEQLVNDTNRVTITPAAAERIVWHDGKVGGAAPLPGAPGSPGVGVGVLTLFAVLVIMTALLALYAVSRVTSRVMLRRLPMQHHRLQHVNDGYFLFVTIAHHRALYRKYPSRAGKVAETVLHIAAAVAEKHKVCVVKFVEDYLLLVAASHPMNILRFAVELQCDLFAHDWKSCCSSINEFYEKVEDKLRDQKNHGPLAVKTPANMALFNGPRMAMGLACGPYHEQRDATGRVDYVGDAVNHAARLCAAAAGGQILCSSRALQDIPPTMLLQVTGSVDVLGHYLLSGLRFPVEVVQIGARDLRGRSFVTLAEQTDTRLVVTDTDRVEDEVFVLNNASREDTMVSAVFE